MSYHALLGTSGMGSYGALGAISFSAASVWSDWLAGSKGDNAAGKRAADSIRAALGQLGFGPVSMGAMWGSAQDKAAYGGFVDKYGVTPTSGMPKWWVNQNGLAKLEELVKAGDVVGGGEVVEFHQVGDQLVSGPKPGAKPIGAGVAKAGLSTGAMVGIAAAVLVGVGLLAMASKKKGSPSSSSTSPATTAAAANRRRHRR